MKRDHDSHAGPKQQHSRTGRKTPPRNAAGPAPARQEGGAGSARVVRLWRYRKQMTDPVLNAMLGYWERLRAGRIAPRRIEVDPRAIEDILEHAFILEQLPGAAPRFRIAGAHLARLMGMEMRGMPADSLIRPAERGPFLALLERIFSDPVVAELELAPEHPACGPARMLLLPMEGHDGRISRILGCLTVRGLEAPVPTPCRLIPAPPRITRIVTAGERDRPAGPEPATAEGAPAPFAGLSEPPAPFAPAPPAAGRRPHLRLVKTDTAGDGPPRAPRGPGKPADPAR